jgi:hypothetical protein
MGTGYNEIFEIFSELRGRRSMKSETRWIVLLFCCYNAHFGFSFIWALVDLKNYNFENVYLSLLVTAAEHDISYYSNKTVVVIKRVCTWQISISLVQAAVTICGMGLSTVKLIAFPRKYMQINLLLYVINARQLWTSLVTVVRLRFVATRLNARPLLRRRSRMSVLQQHILRESAEWPPRSPSPTAPQFPWVPINHFHSSQLGNICVEL